MSFIEIENLSFSYQSINDDYLALKNLNLNTHKGDFLCVVGHSGCGKSTLLNIIGGFLKPQNG
ncbi:hypothetical protein AZF37_03470 [endosymbiont 'TC1' of Trimyema compressum]|nr:hypothetical protein AZF37_03470 [endosymbiont 'TC1' of Trimyema compressum]